MGLCDEVFKMVHMEGSYWSYDTVKKRLNYIIAELLAQAKLNKAVDLFREWQKDFDKLKGHK